jgi:phosphomevalonate kinase
MIKKWIIPFLSVLLVFLFVSLPFPDSLFTKKMKPGGQSVKGPWMMVQRVEKDEAEDLSIRLYKELQETLDNWLRSLNERIESKEISRIEVRFLEVLRNILEWIKEKVDAKIESLKEKSPPKKKKDLLQET